MAGIFIGSLDTASNSLVLFMLGPDRSPPYTQSLHAFVGMGFVLGKLIFAKAKCRKFNCSLMASLMLFRIIDSETVPP